MRKVGDYRWSQISMWKMLPTEAYRAYRQSDDGRHTFEFALEQITEIISDNHWRVRRVLKTEVTPEILKLAGEP